jgi:hypothetical protein
MKSIEFQINDTLLFDNIDHAWTVLFDSTIDGSKQKLNFTCNYIQYCCHKSSFTDDWILMRRFALGRSDAIVRRGRVDNRDWNIIACGNPTAIRAVIDTIIN